MFIGALHRRVTLGFPLKMEFRRFFENMLTLGLTCKCSVIFDWVCTEEISAKPSMILFSPGAKTHIEALLLDF